MLKLNNIEVIYSDVILVLKGVSLEVPDGKIISLLGAGIAAVVYFKQLPLLTPAFEALDISLIKNVRI